MFTEESTKDNKCSRIGCTKVFNENGDSIKVVQFWNVQLSSRGRVDLCPDCFEMLKDWLLGKLELTDLRHDTNNINTAI